MIEKKEKLSDIQINDEGVIAWGINIIIIEEGEEISRSCKRTSICPNYADDKSLLPELVQEVIRINWTPEVIEAYKASLPQSEEVVERESDSVIEEA
jgi:hypothetical protein